MEAPTKKKGEVCRRVVRRTLLCVALLLVIAAWSSVLTARPISGSRLTLASISIPRQGQDSAYNLNPSSAPGIGTLPKGGSSWEFQAPFPTVWALNGLFMVSALEGWAVDDEGGIFHTTDGGVTWAAQNSNTNQQLNAVYFHDNLNGWAIGNIALYTTDGGNTWNNSNTPVSTNYGLAFTDLTHGIAVGGGGLIFRTTDGGRNWATVPSPTQSNLKEVAFADAVHGWAVGGEGTIINTTDGGATWAQQSSGSSAFLDGLSFVSALEGWAAGGNVFLHTTDGGATWLPESVPPGTWVYSLHFSDSLHGWAAGEDANIVATTDGGLTWTTQYSAANNPPYLSWFWGVSSADGVHVVVVGGGGAVYSTRDGGANWILRTSGSIMDSYDLEATDKDHAWSSTRAGDILYTTNGGLFWNLVHIGMEDQFGRFSSISFSDNDHGWVAGLEFVTQEIGLIYHTTDGGLTWVNQSVQGMPGCQTVQALDTQTAVITAGGIYRTTDGGASWQGPLYPGGSTQYSGLYFASTTVGWASSIDGAIAKSTDGGASWTVQRPVGGSENFKNVTFADLNNGWASGYHGTLFHTTNGGTTWAPQNAGLPSGANILGLSAPDPADVWISGGGMNVAPFVKRTTDSGATWFTDQPSPVFSGSQWNALLFLDADYGWVGGGTIPPPTQP